MTYTLAKLKEFVQVITNDRFFNTPERALDRAYQAALKIESIEKEYFKGGKVPTEAVSDGSHAAAFLRAELEKNLNVIKLKLGEFKASSLILLDSLSSVQLEQLKFIDAVLARYAAPAISLSGLVPTFKTAMFQSDKVDKVEEKVEKANQPPPPKSKLDKTGVLPRSIGNTLNRIIKELNPKTEEEEIVRKFRSSRDKTVIAVKFILVLIIIPLLTQQLSKWFIVSPLVERFNTEETAQVFLNYEMQEEAFKELQSFEESLKFSALIHASPRISEEEKEEKVQEKAIEIAEDFRGKSKDAISNVFADLIAVAAFVLTLLVSRKQIVVLKSFMDEVLYGLSDSAKAFILILTTDIFVGFHSPHGWEVLLEGIASHLGIAANHSMISLFIATVPVIMDTVFKYWIFRYMSRMSPSTVATYKGMNE
jgi:CemA family